MVDIKDEFGDEEIRVVLVGKSLGGLLSVSIWTQWLAILKSSLSVIAFYSEYV